jgi:hypothetical protein
MAIWRKGNIESSALAFEQARRITPAEVKAYRKAIEAMTRDNASLRTAIEEIARLLAAKESSEELRPFR